MGTGNFSPNIPG